MDQLATASVAADHEISRAGSRDRADTDSAARWCRWMSLALGGDVPVGLYSRVKNTLNVHYFYAAGYAHSAFPKTPLLLASVRAKVVVGHLPCDGNPLELLAVPIKDSQGRHWVVGCALPAKNVIVRRAAQRLIRLGATWLATPTKVSVTPINALCHQMDNAQSEQHAAQMLVDTLSQLMPAWRVCYFAANGVNGLNLRAVDSTPVPALMNPWQRSLARVAREFRIQQHRTTGILSYAEGDSDSAFEHREQARHLRQHGGKRIVCLGLTPNAGERCAVLIAESDAHEDANAIDFQALMAQLRSIAPTLAWHNRNAQSVWSSAVRRARLSQWWPRLKRIKFKVGFAVALIVLTVVANVYTVPDVVTAPAELVGEARQVISAPREGIIESVRVKAGDTVQPGAVLASLNTDDLKVQRDKWLAQIAKVDAEYHAALAAGDRSLTTLHRARRAELEAELAFTDAEITRSVLTSDRESVITVSQLDERLGTAVAQGEALFETASRENFSLEVQVPDKDIDSIEGGLQGELLLAAKPDTAFAIEVTRIAPKASVHQERNVFVVHAIVDGLPSDVMPGMTGFTRMTNGSVTLFSAWTRRLREVFWLVAWRVGLV